MTLLQHAPDAAPVAAVITDALVAVDVARHAAGWAGPGGPLLLLVPLPRLEPTLRPTTLERGRRRRAHETAAVVGRVAPTLAGHDGEVRWISVPYRPDESRPAAPVATAVARAAAHHGVRALVAPDPVAAHVPARPGMAVVRVRGRDRWARQVRPDATRDRPAGACGDHGRGDDASASGDPGARGGGA